MTKLKLTQAQLEKVSDYLIDLSKLLVGSTLVAVFVPKSTGGDFDVWSFVAGILLAWIAFILGLKFTPSKAIKI